MSLAVTIDPRSLASMKRMQNALAVYGAESSRVPAKFIADATSKLLLGEDADGGGRNEGLYSRLAALAPAKGAAKGEAEARGYRMGRKDSTSLSLARSRVNEMLGKGESGAFKIVSDKSRSALTLGTVIKSGKKRQELRTFVRFGSRSKAAQSAVGLTRNQVKNSGGVLLNRQAAIVAMALIRREAARRADAVQFLPSRYRRTLTKLRGVAYRGGNAVGMRGGSADQSRFHLHETALVSNAKGTVMGALELLVSGSSASATIIGRRGLHTAAERAALAESMDMVANYAVRRVLQNTKASAENLHRAAQLSR